MRWAHPRRPPTASTSTCDAPRRAARPPADDASLARVTAVRVVTADDVSHVRVTAGGVPLARVTACGMPLAHLTAVRVVTADGVSLARVMAVHVVTADDAFLAHVVTAVYVQ